MVKSDILGHQTLGHEAIISLDVNIVRNQDQIDGIRKRMSLINNKSPTLCTAKWLQSTIYLHNGRTHSCHHPATHAIDQKAIVKDPSLLHNTEKKIQARKEMWEGKQVRECEYCWNIENLKKGHISDRMYKSSDMRWSFPYLEEIKSAKFSQSTFPRYLEVVFENTCNLKCMYCSPDISSAWVQEIQKYGHYPTSLSTGNLELLRKQGKIPLSSKEHNPYKEAFWKWWPELMSYLKVFRITGGEPLLAKETWKCIDKIINSKPVDLDFSINSNLSVPLHLIERLILLSADITKKTHKFEIYTSCEADGEAAEYIRYGMNYKQYMNNVELFLRKAPETTLVSFMITFNALSLSTFIKFLERILILRKKFNKKRSFNRIPFMISYLRWPQFLSMRILPREIREKYADKFHEFAKNNTANNDEELDTLYLEEKDQINRLCDFMLKEIPENELKRNQKDFALFIDEYDRRKSTDFISVFPELKNFLLECRKKWSNDSEISIPWMNIKNFLQ